MEVRFLSRALSRDWTIMSISDRQQQLDSIINWALWEGIRLYGLNQDPVAALIAQRVEEWLVAEEDFGGGQG